MTHKFLHMGLTPPPPFTQCVKKTSALVDNGFPKAQRRILYVLTTLQSFDF